MGVAADLEDLKLDKLHRRTLGYPLIILLTRSSARLNRSLFYLQLALHFLSIFLLVTVLHRLAVSRKLVFALVVIMLLPLHVVSAAYVLTETVTQFLLVTGIVALVAWLDKGQWPWLAISGLSLGFSGIVRPTYQLLFAAIVPLLLLFIPLFPHIRKRLLTAAVAIFMCASIIVGGMVLFNACQFQFAGLTPLSGFNLSTRTVRFVERLPDEYAQVRDILIKYRDLYLVRPGWHHTGYMYIWGARAELQEATKLSEPELSKYVLRLNLLLIGKAPQQYLEEVTRALSTYWFPYTTPLSNFHSRSVQLIWTLLHFATVAVFFIQTMLLASFGLLFVGFPSWLRQSISSILVEGRLRFMIMVLALAVIFYTMIISTMVESGFPRYRTPTDMFILFATLLGFDTFIRIRHRLQSFNVVVKFGTGS